MHEEAADALRVHLADLTDELGGLKVEASSPGFVAAAMQRMASDAELRQRMGAAARRRVEERFTLKRMVDDHLALYRACIQRP